MITSKRFWMILAVALSSAAVLIGIALTIRATASSQIEQIRAINHAELLSEAREMIGQFDKFGALRYGEDADMREPIILDCRESKFATVLPEAIQATHPATITLYRDRLSIRLRQSSVLVMAFSDGVKGYGSERLAAGLWLIHGGQMLYEDPQLSEAANRHRTGLTGDAESSVP